MQEQIENINIDENKELFEYEMTEVLLKLKGEFSAFSAKDTKYAEYAVPEEELKINVNPAPVSFEQLLLDIGTVELPENMDIAEVPQVQVPVNDIVIAVPNTEIDGGIQTVATPEIADIKVIIPETMIGEIANEFPGIEMETIASVSVPEAKVNAIEIANMNVDYVLPEGMTIPDTSVGAVTIPNPNFEIPQVEVPAYSPVTIKDVQANAVENITVAIPDTNIGNLPATAAAETGTLKIEVPEANVKTDLSLQDIEAKYAAVDMPAVAEDIASKLGSIGSVTIADIKIAIPNTDKPAIPEWKPVVKQTSTIPGVVLPQKMPNGEIKKVVITDLNSVEVPPKPEVDEAIANILAMFKA